MIARHAARSRNWCRVKKRALQRRGIAVTVGNVTAKEFRKLRRNMGLTQSGLAQALGVSRAAVSRWEAGKRGVDSVLALAMECLTERIAKKWKVKNGK